MKKSISVVVLMIGVSSFFVGGLKAIDWAKAQEARRDLNQFHIEKQQ